MAKGCSKKAEKSKSSAGANESTEIGAKAPKGLRKQLRRLESQLVEAARLESKRIRKLERARNRRQVVEAALAFAVVEMAEETSMPAKAQAPETPASAPTAAVKAPAKAPAAKPAAAAAKPAPTARTRTPRPAAKTAAAPRRPAPKPKLAVPPEA
jgi:translation initiation factor IF-2